MKRSKKIFLGFSLVFFLVIGYVVYDISQKTTFPGSKSNVKEDTSTFADSTNNPPIDSLKINRKSP